MITHISTVAIYVHDQDRAKQFYTEKLGFDLHGDTPFYPGASERWLAVAPKGAQTEVILMAMNEQSQHYAATMGQTQSLTFNTANIAETFAEYRARGVNIVMEPTQDFWGTWGLLEDSEGNKLMVVELAPM